MTKKRWSKNEVKVLQKLYPELGMSVSLSMLKNRLPKRTVQAIFRKAKYLGLNRIYYRIPNGDAYKLLEETPEAYYWAGFITADGHINDNTHLQVRLSLKDKNHILKLAKYLNFKNIRYYNNHGFPAIALELKDNFVIPQFAEKFNLVQNKTYNPPNLDWLRGDNFLAFLAGYIDGDGTIHYVNGRYVGLSIVGHKNWLRNFQMFEHKLYAILKVPQFFNRSVARLDNYNRALINLGDYALLRAFKYKIRSLKLPVLSRKWNKINTARSLNKSEKIRLKKGV